MKIELDVSFESVDKLIRSELIGHAMDMLAEGYDPYETADQKSHLFSSFCKVIEFYSTVGEWRDFQEQVRGKQVK